MKYHKIGLVIIAAVLAAVGEMALPRQEVSPSGDPSVLLGEDFKIRVSTMKEPEGQWLTLVPWEEIKDAVRFDEVQPFHTPNRVLAIKDGKCAVISRKTLLDRLNAELGVQPKQGP